MFVDDFKIQAKTVPKLQTTLDKCEPCANKYQIIWSAPKCFEMRQADQEIVTFLSGFRLTKVTKATYLGFSATAKGTDTTASMQRIQTATMQAKGLAHHDIHAGQIASKPIFISTATY